MSLSKNLTEERSKEILGHCSEKLRGQGVNLKVFFVVCGSRGDEEKVLMVKEEEKETVVNKLDKVFYSRIYSVQSSDLKLEEFTPEKIELPRTMRGNKQRLMSEFVSTSNLSIFDNSMAASTSSRASNSKSKPAKQSSMNKFVYKKQTPPAKPQWMHRLKLEFENLESKQPSEDMSEGLEDIVCNWTISDFENFDNGDFFEDNKSEPDGTVFNMIADIIDEVLDIVSEGWDVDNEKLESKQPSEDMSEGLEDIVCNWTNHDFENLDNGYFFEDNIEVKIDLSRVVNSEPGFPSENDTFDGELLEDIVSDWDVDDFTEKESDYFELKSRKRKVCEGKFFEEDMELERKKCREVKEGMDCEDEKTLEETVKRLLDDVLDHIDYGETGKANADSSSSDEQMV